MRQCSEFRPSPESDSRRVCVICDSRQERGAAEPVPHLRMGGYAIEAALWRS
jgi:hypothetical protein